MATTLQWSYYINKGLAPGEEFVYIWGPDARLNGLVNITGFPNTNLVDTRVAMRVSFITTESIDQSRGAGFSVNQTTVWAGFVNAGDQHIDDFTAGLTIAVP